MKTRTEKILIVLKLLAIIGAIGYSIDCGAQLTSFVASFINPAWAKHTYQADMNMFRILEHGICFYSCAMSLMIIASALKATIWYVVFDLLLKLKLQTPFSMQVEKKNRKNCLPVSQCLDSKRHFMEDIYLLPYAGYGHSVTC